jgi:hypothetical protein
MLTNRLKLKNKIKQIKNIQDELIEKKSKNKLVL